MPEAIRTQNLKRASLLYLLQDDDILLAYKKRGLAQGKLLGIGGKALQHESIEETTIREAEEEVGIVPEQLEYVATINFYTPDWNLQVCTFLSRTWQGCPQESEEMSPAWFNREAIPYHLMWADSRYWLPQVLAGKHLHGSFYYNERFNITSYTLSEGSPYFEEVRG